MTGWMMEMLFVTTVLVAFVMMVRGAVALEGAPGVLDQAALRRMLTV